MKHRARKRTKVKGTIYLIHFLAPFGHAKHYLGWTSNLEERLLAHECGSGSNLMRHVHNAGIGWVLARTWEGTRFDERRMKCNGHSRRCPICRDEARGKPIDAQARVFNT